jgi:5-methylcytosine-specific restriction endonuclease McrA
MVENTDQNNDENKTENKDINVNENINKNIDKIITKIIKKPQYKKRKIKNKRKNKNKNKKKNKTIKTIKKIPKSKVLNTDTDIIIHNHKETIPKRIRELVWTTNNSETFSTKCFVTWCENKINVFNFQVGHDIPESKGGTLDIDNLKPICSNCNLSMGNKYTITEWCKLIKIIPLN